LRDSQDLQTFVVGETMEEYLYSPKLAGMLTVGFQEKYYTQIWPFIELEGGRAVIQNISGFATKTNYFVYPVWDDAAPQENRFELKYIDSIKINGVDIYRVYQRIR